MYFRKDNHRCISDIWLFIAWKKKMSGFIFCCPGGRIIGWYKEADFGLRWEGTFLLLVHWWNCCLAKRWTSGPWNCSNSCFKMWVLLLFRYGEPTVQEMTAIEKGSLLQFQEKRTYMPHRDTQVSTGVWQEQKGAGGRRHGHEPCGFHGQGRISILTVG